MRWLSLLVCCAVPAVVHSIRWEPGARDRAEKGYDLMVTDPITTDSCNMTAKGLFVFQNFTLINITRARFDGSGNKQRIDGSVADQNMTLNHQLTYGLTEKWEIDAIPLPVIINDNTREVDGPRVGLGDATAWSRYLIYEQKLISPFIPSVLMFNMVKAPTGTVDLGDTTGRRTFGTLMTEFHNGPNVMWEFRPVVINLNFWYAATFGNFFHAPSGAIYDSPGDMLETNASVEWVLRDYADDSSVLFAEVNQTYQGRFSLRGIETNQPIVYIVQATVGFAEFIDRNTFLIVSLSATVYGLNTYQNRGPYLSAGKTFSFGREARD